MPTISRRAVIGGGLAAATLVGCARTSDGVVRSSGELESEHVPGLRTRWRLALPADPNDGGTPCVVVLHGTGGDAEHAFSTLHLDEHVATTRLGVASVDGGDHYWHARETGADPGAMVMEDFLPLVARESRYAGKVAFLGWSMGGYGALLLASELGPDRVAAVVAESSALWTDASRSNPGAFDDREDFEAHDVFDPARTRVLAQLPVRLDCGRSDDFVPGNRAFAAALPSAEFTLDEGGHTNEYWRTHAGAQLSWIRQQFDAQ